MEDGLSHSHRSSYRFEQLLRIVSHAVLEHDLDIFDVGDGLCWVALNDDEVGLLSAGDGADVVAFAQKLGAVCRGDLDCLDWREASLDEQLHFALVRKTSKQSTIAGGIGARQEQSASSDEGALELHL